MKNVTAKHMIDAFYEAKRVYDNLPPLPDGITPSYMHLLDAITELSKSGKVRVSDLSSYLNVARPGVTRVLNEMDAKGLIVKNPDPTDGRAVIPELTAKGRKLHHEYTVQYFDKVTSALSEISDDEVENMIDLIHTIFDLMRK